MTSAGTSPIEAVAVASADRPETLERGLRSLTAHFGVSRHRPRLLVIDGSRNHQAEVQDVIRRLGEAAPSCEYIGPEAAQTLRATLATERVPDNVLAYGLAPGDVGSNRNLASVLTAGTRVLMLDDDVVAEPWSLGADLGGVILAGHTDLRAWRFHASRKAATEAATRSNANLLAAHGALLGEPLGAVLRQSSSPPNADRACSHLQTMVRDGAPARVRVSFAGLAGDSASYCPSRRLLLQGEVRRQLLTDPSAFRLAMTSREVWRIAPETTLTHDPACMAYCMGLANDELLPPFMPFGRNEDSVFGAMLALADPMALFAHLPLGIIHDSHRSSLYPIDQRTQSAQQTRLSELLLFELQALAPSIPAGSSRERLEWIGHRLIALGNAPARTFADRVTHAVVADRRRALAVMASTTEDAAMPDYWRAAVDAYRIALQESAKHPRFFVPIECQSGDAFADRFVRTQNFLRQFGEFIVWWPRIWETARRLNQHRSATHPDRI